MTSSRAPHRNIALSLLLAVIASSLSLLVAPETAASGGWGWRRSERCLMRKVNDKRAARGRSRLDWDKQLGYVGRRHANRMADRRSVYHDGRLGAKVTRWRSLGQNTGRGGGCRSLFRKFWASSTHRSIMLGRWRFMGIGTSSAGGRLYVQMVFESRRNPGNIWSYP